MSTPIAVPNAHAPPVLPDQLASRDVREEKYYKFEETTIRALFVRAARALVAKEPPEIREKLFELFLDALMRGFIPAGRVLSASGLALDATLINCFVQRIGDWIKGTRDGIPGIYDALAQTGKTLSLGGGVGFDWSDIRPAAAMVKGALARASGPLS